MEITHNKALARFEQNHRLAADRENTYPQVISWWIESETETYVIVAYLVYNGQISEERAVRYLKSELDATPE